MKRSFQNISSIAAIAGAFFLATGSAFASGEPRVIEFHTEKVGEVMHWMPEKVEVTQGEHVKFVVKHELEGGVEFHGFTIKELGIAKQVDRKKVLEIDEMLPATLKPGTYKISCQFHPKHAVSSLLVVKEAKAK